MKLMYKEGWDEACRRMEAWWQGEIIDRVPIKVTAPRGEIKEPEVSRDNLENYFTDPDWVIPRLEKTIESTYWAGEAFPLMFPVSIGIVAILASYLGSPRQFVDTRTTWSKPIIDSWNNRPEFCFNPHNKWWQKTKLLLEKAAERASGRYYVGVPDLNGPSEVLARLRGTENLAIDTIEHPQKVKETVEKINYVWLRYWEATHGIVHQHVGGYIFWMGIYSDAPATDLQSDFSCLLSSDTFNKLILPSIEKQTEWIPRTIYHLDGPGALQHLDSLLSLPKLTGIQWVPGAGSPPMSEWIPLLQKIQKAGKLLYVTCEKQEVKKLVRELNPEGLLLDTRCSSVQEADSLIEEVRRSM